MLNFHTCPGLMALGLSLIFSWGCSRAPLNSPEQAMRLTSPPRLADDLPLESLLSAVGQEITFLESRSKPSDELRFGPRVITQVDYLTGLRRFVELSKQAGTSAELIQAVQREFDFYEVYGKESWGDVFVTSYFEPLIQGSLKRTARFSQPLYSAPADLVALNLSLFDSKYSGDRTLRGRMDGKKLLPYYTREEIDSKNALQGKKLEICWVDPIDAFFLQIQGSGTVALENGRELRINYAEKNGQRYESLGNFLRDRIPPEKMNQASIEAYLRALPAAELQALLNRNPSYVFFQATNQSAVTLLGVPATGGRTIATDSRIFPKGALAFLITTQPSFENKDAPEPREFTPLSRFVLDQDTGGAIQGPGRVDLFWGRGAEAKRSAGFMKQRGTLYYLVPKPKSS